MITINEKEFMLISNFVKLNYGINLTKEKKTLIEGRLNLVVDKLGFNNFTDYFNYVISDSDALKIFINKITTNHTFFMRESKHFYYFKEKVLPSLLTKVTDKDLRI
jgi:chemotaxis protein methyltransferase CheR